MVTRIRTRAHARRPRCACRGSESPEMSRQTLGYCIINARGAAGRTAAPRGGQRRAARAVRPQRPAAPRAVAEVRRGGVPARGAERCFVGEEGEEGTDVVERGEAGA